MHNAVQLGKKAFTWSVVVLTIFWSMGIAALVPLVAQAQTSCPTLNAGDLFKVKGNSAVYLLNANMQRMYFPHSTVYKSWYKDFSGVVEIPSTCVDAYPAPSAPPFGVNFRSGAKLVKLQISPSVYVVEPGNKVSKLGSEAVAKALYGDNWASQVVDIADPFWPNYVNKGAELTEAVPHNGMLLKVAGSSKVFLVKDGKKMEVDGTVRGDVRTVTQAVADKAATDTGTVAAASVYANPSQGVGSGVTPTPTGSPTPSPTAAGSVTISLASDTPKGTYAVDNAARVPFTKIVFTAGDADVTIDSFKVIRGGSPAINGDFSQINVVDPDGNLINDVGKTLNADNLVTFTDDIVVKANGSKTYMLVGDMANPVTTGNVPTLGLLSVETKATVNGTLPLYGNPVTTNTNVTLGTATLAEGTSVGTITKQIGATNINLANLKISVATEDFQIERIVFYNSSTAAIADVINPVLKFTNNKVVDGKWSGKYIVFDLSACTADCKILKGNDKTYSVFADIVGGSGRAVDIDIQRAVHVLAKDLKNMYYVTPTNSANNMTNIVNISQGKLNVTKTDNVKTSNVPENTTNVALGSFNFKVTGEPIDIRTLVFRVSTTGNGSQAQGLVPTGIDSITLYDAAGKALTSGQDGVGSTSPGYATSTDTFTLQPGDNILTVKAKIDSTPNPNETVMISVDMRNSTQFDARGQNSNETITLGSYATPNSLVDANIQTIKTSALRVTQLPTPPTTTYAAGAGTVTLAQVLLDASDSSEDLKVTQFKTKDFADGGGKTIDIQSIHLYVDKDGDSYNGAGSDVALSETQSGSDSTANNDEAFTFNLSGDDQFLVKTGKKVVVTIKGNIAGGAAVGNHIFRTNAANDVTATALSSQTEVTEVIDTSPQGQAVKIATAGGTIEVALDASNSDARMFAAGTKGVTLAVFKVTATTTEDVELDYVYFTQRVTDTASAAYQDYDLLYLTDDAGKRLGSIVPTSTKPLIDLDVGAFVVKQVAGSGSRLYLKADLAIISPSANVTVGGHALGFNIAVAGDVTAKGASTGTGSVEYLASGSSAPNANTHYLFKGTPTVEKLSVPGTLSSNADMFKLKVTANTNDVGLYKFTFDVVTSTVNLSQLELYEISEGNETLLYSSSSVAWAGNATVPEIYFNDTDPTVVPAPSGQGGADGGGFIHAGKERVIAAGASKTYVLRGTFTGVSAGDSVSTRMAGDNAGLAGADLTGFNTLATSTQRLDSTVNNDFVWSDRTSASHGTTTADWFNGFLVSGLASVSSSASVLSI